MSAEKSPEARKAGPPAHKSHLDKDFPLLFSVDTRALRTGKGVFDLKYILTAAFVWFVTSFPAIHIRNIYEWHHHTLGAQGLHPDLVDAYIGKTIWLTLALSVLAPLLIWAFEAAVVRISKLGFKESLIIGPVVGIVSGSAMYSQLNASYAAATGVRLGETNFAYSGLVSGLLAGEFCRRYYLSKTENNAKGRGLKGRFVSSAIITWVVLLKVLESVYLSSIPPERDPFGVHVFMVISVLLWTPLACQFLWRLLPQGFPLDYVLCVAAGVTFPLLLGLILIYPVGLSLYAGFTPAAYGMLWGLLLLHVSGPTRVVALVFVLPGLVWGLIVGSLRRRFLRLQ